MSTLPDQATVALKTIESLLDGISLNGTDGLRHSFMFDKPGRYASSYGTFGVDIFHNRKQHIRTCLYLRRYGPAHLKSLSVEDIWGHLTSFVSKNYWPIAEQIFGKRFEGSFGSILTSECKQNLANTLLVSAIFKPNNDLTLFPLVPVQVEGSFEGSNFVLSDPLHLLTTKVKDMAFAKHILPQHFPPIDPQKIKIEIPSSWLGVMAPSIQASKHWRSAILGAIKLTPMHRYRYRNSGRPMFGGLTTFSYEGNVSFNFGLPHTPASMYDIVIKKEDRAWLHELDNILSGNTSDSERKIRALKYYYRAWFDDDDERFPTFFMAIDALCGHQGLKHSETVVNALYPILGTQYHEKRIKDLLDMRGDSHHGRAPDITDSKEYQKYYEKYEENPLHDMEIITAVYLRSVIFGSSFREQDKPAPVL
jgi:hypothetical protein